MSHQLPTHCPATGTRPWPARVWAFLLAVALGLWACGAQAALEVGKMPGASVSLTGELAFLQDSGGRLTLADVQLQDATLPFQQGDPQAHALQLGYTHEPWWLRLRLRNDTDQPVQRYIEIGLSRLTHLSFYQPEAGGGTRATHTGSLAPFASRAYPNRNFVFPVTLPPHSEGTYHVRVESSSALIVPARVWTPEGFRRHERVDYLAQGWYVGMVTAMALFNLFLFVALRQKLYLVYVSVVASIAFTVCSHNGLVKEFMSADSPGWSLSSSSVGYALSVGLLLLFMRHMLATQQVLPRVDRWLRRVMWAYLLLVPAALALFHQALIYPVQFLTLALIGLELAVVLYLCWRRQRSAYFFILAYSVLIVVACINLVASLGVIPLPWDVGWSSQVASALEMLLLSLALADRMNQIRLERDHSQQLAAQLQTQLVDQLRGSEQRLKQLVSQRVDELRRLIDMLSHEIRTPMSVIRMFLSMSQPSERSRAQALQAVHDADAIIERCLEADQIDHGSVAIKPQRCRVDEVVRGLGLAALEGGRIQLSAPEPCEVTTDLQLLKVLLSNLIDNALKYSPPGTAVQITVQAAEVGQRAGTLVRVSNPVGMAGRPDPAQVFQKFYRSPAAHGRSGSGLGLYLVRHFAKLLGGTIDYRPDDRGVNFELWIPR